MSWKALAPVIFLGAVSAQIDIEPPTGVVGCLLSNDCIEMGDDGLDIGKLINCVQRIPIVNPNPACEEFVDVIGITACLASCGEGDTGCLVECALDNIEFQEDYLPRPVQDRIIYAGNDDSIRVDGTSLCMGIQMEGFLGTRGEELGVMACEGAEDGTEQWALQDRNIRMVGTDLCVAPSGIGAGIPYPGTTLATTRCGSGVATSTRFEYDANSRQLKHSLTGLCVSGNGRFTDVPKNGTAILLQICDSNNEMMRWSFQQQPSRNTLQLLDSKPNLSEFAAALRAAGLSDRLEDVSVETTVIAPSNDAFADLSSELRTALFDDANQNVLQDLLLFHLIDGTHFTEDLTTKCITGVACLGAPTLSGMRLPVAQGLDCDGTGIIVPRPGLVCTTLVVLTKLNDADQDRTQRDITTLNGLVHVVDKLMVPEPLLARLQM